MAGNNDTVSYAVQTYSERGRTWGQYHVRGQKQAEEHASELAAKLGCIARVVLDDPRCIGTAPVVCYVYRPDGSDMMGDAAVHPAYQYSWGWR
jgi:hypothetical protein